MSFVCAFCLSLNAPCKLSVLSRRSCSKASSAARHEFETSSSYTEVTLTFAAVYCRCPCTYQRSPPQGGGVPLTCCSSASASSVSWLQLASTMVQSGLTGDGDCPWDWLPSLLSFWEWAPCSCQTLLTPFFSVERWRKPARFLRVTEVSRGLSHHG